jgi:thiamine monophosphate synthase
LQCLIFHCMKLIVISPPENLNEEKQILPSLFAEGLEKFHVRKPQFSKSEIESYISEIPAVYHPRLVIHGLPELQKSYSTGGLHLKNLTERNIYSGISVSCSVHTFEEAENYASLCTYMFLSPVFDSISKEGYRSAFEPEQLKLFLKKYKAAGNKAELFALGGITAENIRKAAETGFDGAAALGFIWNNPAQAVEKFKTLKQIALEYRAATKINH